MENRNGITSSGSPGGALPPTSGENLVQPVPIRQRGFDTSQSNEEDRGRPTQSENSRPSHIRLPTSSADDALSTSRSRRLLSGYMFGNPPSPQESVPSSPTKNGGILVNLVKSPTDSAIADDEEVDEEKIPGYSNPPPPSQTRDSTPISTVSSSPDLTRPPSVPAPPLDTAQKEEHKMSSSIGTVGTVGTSGTVNEQIKAQDKAQDKERAANEELRRRRMSRVRDKEIGYDALTGLSDGEADADDNAPQAVFGSRQYLLGAEGEAGEYRFPRHRLRTRMKGGSICSLKVPFCKPADHRREQDPPCHCRVWKFLTSYISPSAYVRDGQGRSGGIADIRNHGGLLFSSVSQCPVS